MWSDWNEYACSASSISDRVRSRSCTNPKPANGGAYCVGEATDTETCSAGTPVCYAGAGAAAGEAAAAVCGCEKDPDTTPKERGTGVTKGSCSSDETCYSNGACRGKFRCRIYLFVSTCIILAL